MIMVVIAGTSGSPWIDNVPNAPSDGQVYNGVMKRCLPLFLLISLPVAAQDWAKQKLEQTPRHREFVTVKHDGRSVETFIAYPEVKGKAPVVLVIHEIFGLSDWAQEVADEFAAA